jgi:aminoglycoside phosphotransferase (APT) family kinase protein
MRKDEVGDLADALGAKVLDVSTLAGGFSHETCLLTLTDARVVARLGGGDPAIEAAVMAAARVHVPVPEVLLVLKSVGAQGRPAMVIDYVAGTPLSTALTESGGLAELGAEVGRVAAGVAAVTFERPGFFGADLTVADQPPWSAQLPGFASSCSARTPEARLSAAERDAWVHLCATHAGELTAIDDQARLAHGDLNPKNILVTRAADGWRVDALLDWEFSYASSPYGDAANMARFGADYPAAFLDGFGRAFAAHQPADLPPPADWAYLGRLLDLFALSDLVTRPLGHPVADQAATVIRQWLSTGIPRWI